MAPAVVAVVTVAYDLPADQRRGLKVCPGRKGAVEERGKGQGGRPGLKSADCPSEPFALALREGRIEGFCWDRLKMEPPAATEDPFYRYSATGEAVVKMGFTWGTEFLLRRTILLLEKPTDGGQELIEQQFSARPRGRTARAQAAQFGKERLLEVVQGVTFRFCRLRQLLGVLELRDERSIGSLPPLEGVNQLVPEHAQGVGFLFSPLGQMRPGGKL